MRPLLALWLFLALAAPAFADSPAIQDRAKLFDKDTVERVTEVIERIYEDFKFHVRIETLEALPGVDPEKWKALREPAARIQRCIDVAKDRADALYLAFEPENKKPLVYVMIVKALPNVTVVAWPDDFNSDPNRYAHYVKLTTLRKKLENGLKKNPNRALRVAIDHYFGELRPPQAPSPLETAPALILVASLLGGWVVLTFIRRQRAAPAKPLPIYQPAMLGSLFGVPASYWVNDRLFYSERPMFTQPVLEPDPTPPAEEVAGSESDEPSSHLVDPPERTGGEEDRP